MAICMCWSLNSTSADSFETTSPPANRFRKTISDYVANSPLPLSVTFSGLALGRIEVLQSMIGDLLVVAPFNTLALAIMLFLCFRRIWPIVVSLSCVGMSIVGTTGIIGAFGDDVDQVTIVFPILMMVVTTASTTHFIDRFRVEYASEKNIQNAAKTTAAAVISATALTSFTTAIGFFSLCWSSQQTLRTFGLYLGLGVLFSLVVVSLVMPASLCLKGEAMLARNARANDGALRFRWLDWTTSKRGAIMVLAFGWVVLIAGGWIASGFRFDYVGSKLFRLDHPTSQAMRLVEEKLSGVAPIEISFEGEKDSMRDPRVLRLMLQSGSWLLEHYDLHGQSLATLVAEANHQLGDGFTIPNSKDAVSQLLFVIEQADDNIASMWVTGDYSHARLHGAIKDLGAHGVDEMHRAFLHEFKDKFAKLGVDLRMTGEVVVGYAGMLNLSRELMQGVIIAIFCVVAVIGLVFRSFSIAVASFLPNALPIVVGVLIYRFTGEVLDPLPGIAFCIAIGMAVDDTIHVIARFREERAEGLSAPDAAKTATRKLGRALIISTVVLMSGFLAMLLSDFKLNMNLGWLGALLLALALVCDLVFLTASLSLRKGTWARAIDQ
ncbi:MAG: MMPL family transporter [Polyangiales bacterium]